MRSPFTKFVKYKPRENYPLYGTGNCLTGYQKQEFLVQVRIISFLVYHLCNLRWSSSLSLLASSHRFLCLRLLTGIFAVINKVAEKPLNPMFVLAGWMCQRLQDKRLHFQTAVWTAKQTRSVAVFCQLLLEERKINK